MSVIQSLHPAAVTGVLLAGTLVVLAGCQGEEGGDRGQRTAPLVTAAPVLRHDLEHRITRTGTLYAEREARIYNQEEGGVLEVRVREGDAVAAGDVLVRLDDRVLRAELAKARAQRRQAEADARRLRGLAARQLVSRETLDRALTNLEVARAEERLLQTRLGYMTVRAPFAGRIAERRINPGDVAPKHTHLLTLVDPDSLLTTVSVSELLLPHIHVGDPVQVRIDALGGASHPGRVVRIHPTVDPATRRGRIEVRLDPVPAGVRAGQFCRVILTVRAPGRLVVPLAAVQQDARGSFVYLVDAEDRVRRRGIRTGLKLGDVVEILDGLAEGDQVVTAGFLDLVPGRKVRLQGAQPAAKPIERDGRA